MNAVFNIETGVSADAANMGALNTQTGGLQGTTAIGGRQVFVGLSSAAMGTLTAGRQYPSYDETRGGISAMGHSAYDANNNIWSAGGGAGANTNYTFRVANSIKYQSANYSGFTFGATYGLGEENTVTQSASNITSLKAGVKICHAL